MKPRRTVAGFDSMTGLASSLGRFLEGKGFPGAGSVPRPLLPALSPLVGAVNRMPAGLIEKLYVAITGLEGIPASALSRVRAEDISRFVVGRYPKRSYPAAMIGSANGAAIHLAAALQIPWLAQTAFIPVKSAVAPEDVGQNLAWGREVAKPLLDHNPELVLHHMHDLLQDQLTIQKLAYFRVKRRRLGETYETFLRECLPRGATLYVLDCRQTWPSQQVAERHFFQFGAVGGVSAEELLSGSDRIDRWRQERGTPAWDIPPPDGQRPEAEWGYDPELDIDIRRIADERGFRLRRLVVPEPMSLSPFVADLYRDWYQRRRIAADRLLVSQFMLLDPLWTLKTGSVPYWTVFNTEQAAQELERYLDDTGPWRDIRLMLFSNGVFAPGQSSIERWQSILRRAERVGELVGADADAYPRDLAGYLRYALALEEIPARLPLPGPLSEQELDRFIEEHGGRYDVDWQEERSRPGRLRAAVPSFAP